MTKDSDEKDARDIILKRRRRFVIASAAASILAGCDTPKACLNVSIPEEPDAGTATATPCLEIAPSVCLKVRHEDDAGVSDAGADAGADAGHDGGNSVSNQQDAGTKPPPPQPPKPRPSVCLRYAPPPKDTK